MELSAVIVFSLVLGCLMDGYAETMPTALSRRKGTGVDTDTKLLDKFKELESSLNSLKVSMQITKTELKAIKQRLRHVEQEGDMYREGLGKVRDELHVTSRGINTQLNGTVGDLSKTRQVMESLTQDVKKLTTCCVVRNETAPGSTTGETFSRDLWLSQVNMQITKTELKAMNHRLRHVEQEGDMYREGLGKVRDELNETRRGINVLEEQARSHARMLRSDLNGTIEDLYNTRQVMEGLSQDVTKLNISWVTTENDLGKVRDELNETRRGINVLEEQARFDARMLRYDLNGTIEDLSNTRQVMEGLSQDVTKLNISWVTTEKDLGKVRDDLNETRRGINVLEEQARSHARMLRYDLNETIEDLSNTRQVMEGLSQDVTKLNISWVTTENDLGKVRDELNETRRGINVLEEQARFDARMLRYDLNGTIEDLSNTRQVMEGLSQDVTKLNISWVTTENDLGKVRDELNETRRGINVLEEQARSHARMLRYDLNGTIEDLSNTRQVMEGLSQDVTKLNISWVTTENDLGKVRDELNETRRGINVLEEQARSHARMLRYDLNGTIEDLSNTRQVMEGLSQDVTKMTTCCVTASTDPSQDPSLITTVPPVTVTTQDSDQRASTDPNQHPSLSTTVPPVTTQDSDQHATPSAATGDDLWDASSDGDLETVRQIVAAGRVDVNYRGEWWSTTPVMMAAYYGHSDVVEFLVGEGADLSLVDGYGNNILHHACLGGHLETVKLMLSLNVADINSRGWTSRTPVMVAAVKGRRDLVKFLVGEGADLSLVDGYGNNILHVACRGGDLETVKLILSLDVADINSRGESSMTPVMRAAERGHRDLVKFLVGEGADLSLVDGWDDNILHVACRGGDLETVKLILSLDVVDINSRGESSMTPVMRAAVRGHRDLVKFLVGEGADLSLVDGWDDNILHVACRGGDLETVKLILSLDVVDINSRGESSMTPVMRAAERGHRDLVKFLVGEGADLSLVDGWDDNILHVACRGGDLETVKLILSLDVVDINSRGESSMTPVMRAAERGHRDLVKFLVGEGADLSLVDSRGYNILHFACWEAGDLETVKLIVSLNVVDVNARNNRGETAADEARRWGHQRMVEFLVSRGGTLSSG